MIPILATDYGNFAAFVVGAPALLLALLMFGCGLIFRRRGLHFVAGGIALVAGINFFTSLREARKSDFTLTVALGSGALLLSAGCALAGYSVRRGVASSRAGSERRGIVPPPTLSPSGACSLAVREEFRRLANEMWERHPTDDDPHDNLLYAMASIEHELNDVGGGNWNPGDNDECLETVFATA